MNRIIISQPWGGLGDNLQFSTLPKLYSEMGYEVYISKTNAYRNPEIYDLVWKLNPYIKGESDEPPNAGHCRRLHFFTPDFIKNIELSHGLVNGTSLYPVVYYTPTTLAEYENTVIYDITSISSSYSDAHIYTMFTQLFAKYPTCDKKKVTFASIANRETPDFQTDQIIVKDIYHYCDIIYSCRAYISLLSGGSVLASALKQNNPTPDIHCVHHSYCDIFTFNNALYYFG